ncbi:unnamed protein product [Rotaria sordida]|uniref:Transmembrane protein n=1 Tax=Rotaria sordida TaxID=392033 RepID=A0A814WEH7_9BILA|nr:unnamed protein product [Rotaria sordida]CAF1477723.1 unnamed protein product [Rotaria sordida]
MFKANGSNRHQINYQRIATRLYLFVLLISLIIISFYLLLNEDLQQNTIRQPLEFQYKELEKTYSSNLYYPCSTVSMNHSTLIMIEPYFHQICSSDLISDAWMDNINGDHVMNDYFSIFDYRNSGIFHFQLLSLLCQHSQQTVNISIKTFLQT